MGQWTPQSFGVKRTGLWAVDTPVIQGWRGLAPLGSGHCEDFCRLKRRLAQTDEGPTLPWASELRNGALRWRREGGSLLCAPAIFCLAN